MRVAESGGESLKSGITHGYNRRHGTYGNG